MTFTLGRQGARRLLVPLEGGAARVPSWSLASAWLPSTSSLCGLANSGVFLQGLYPPPPLWPQDALLSPVCPLHTPSLFPTQQGPFLASFPHIPSQSSLPTAAREAVLNTLCPLLVLTSLQSISNYQASCILFDFFVCPPH